MKILYRQDGSIKDIELSHYVNQNNNNVDEIDVAIEGKEPSEYIATAYFTLPDGTQNSILISTEKTFELHNKQYNGLSFFLTNAQTLYAGVLEMTIEFKDSENTSHILFTYKTKFTINATGGLPDYTNITLSEYNNLVDAINGSILPVIPYLTVAPTEDNENGIKIVVIAEEPDTYYDGYLYVITGE